jgi:hypothetical protein
MAGLNDLGWSNEDYDDLCELQARATDPQQRLQRLTQMQQLMYEKQPMIVLDYPRRLQAVNVRTWSGWQPYAEGSVWHNALDRQSYVMLSPRPTVAEKSVVSPVLIAWIAGGIALVAALVVVAVLVGRRRERAFEARWGAEQAAAHERGEA